jgi:protein-L-isoaspartate O-methyltransferase
LTRPTVLLISPGILRWTDQDFGLPHLVSMGGMIERDTPARVVLLDLGYEGGDHRSLARTIEGLGPLLCVGVSCYSSFDYRRVMSVGRFLRELLPGVPLVTGGYHASALPDDVVFEGSPFDAVIQGEGERPMVEIVRTLLGGGTLSPRYGPDVVPELDTLPPYRWDLLDRYWPRANDLGRKLQIYLSRGCTYHCTFCMERAKSGYTWRAFSPDRAIDELRRLAHKTDLSAWVVNVADPLFGFQRRWRRTVLEGVLREGIAPRQFWTLTRSDDLDDEDVSLLARARFSIGIGLESGSPRMLRIMQKGNAPAAYLDALRRLAGLSRKHGLNWAANVIIGHPGEDLASMQETRAFLEALYLDAPETCGWLSVDPFRLYPGADVFERIHTWEATHGARFHHPDWWRRWHDGGFYAQHVDPSATLSFEERVRFMYDAYPPLLSEVARRFRGQGRSIDRVFARSLQEQSELLSVATRDRLLATARRAAAAPAEREPLAHRPLGLQMRDPWVRRREDAVRRLLEEGVLRTERVIEALLEVGPERHLPSNLAEAVLAGHALPTREGELAAAPTVGALAIGLEALGLGPGDHAADLAAGSGWVSAVLAELVGEGGQVTCVGYGEPRLAPLPPRVRVVGRRPGAPWAIDPPIDGAWLGACAPRAPRALTTLLADGGRCVTALGPRFRPQDLVVLTRRGDALQEHRLARVSFPVLGGHGGWVPAGTGFSAVPPVTVERPPGPARAFVVFARLDLGADAASCFDPRLPPAPWAPALVAAWGAAPGRLALVAEVLRHRDVSALQAALRERPPAALQDTSGRALCVGFADALAALDMDPSDTSADVSAPPPGSGAADPERLVAAVAQLRALLWDAQPSAPPPLAILDCPALGGRARAATAGGLRRVATSLAEPFDHVVMQVLHEEVHALTDALVLARRPAGDRDTRLGTPGFALHAELETVAIDATEALLASKAPAWTPAFEAWNARVGWSRRD